MARCLNYFGESSSVRWESSRGVRGALTSAKLWARPFWQYDMSGGLPHSFSLMAIYARAGHRCEKPCQPETTIKCRRYKQQLQWIPTNPIEHRAFPRFAAPLLSDIHMQKCASNKTQSFQCCTTPLTACWAQFLFLAFPPTEPFVGGGGGGGTGPNGRGAVSMLSSSVSSSYSSLPSSSSS